MKKTNPLIPSILLIWLSACAPSGSPAATATPSHTPSFPAAAVATETRTRTRTATPAGKKLVVNSTAGMGIGTLYQALLDARTGDTITFDPQFFPPDNPATIMVDSAENGSGLPEISQGGVTIDASDAGVILDGRGILGNGDAIWITSDANTICGLQIINFPGMGISIRGGSYNRIGGDRKTGRGPLGQGNLVSRNAYGIYLSDENTAFNTITGNIIGGDPTGTYQLDATDFWIENEWGNRYDGMLINYGPRQNIIGPENIVAFNHYNGIQMIGGNTAGNTVFRNSIHDNAGAGIQLNAGANGQTDAPATGEINWETGAIEGTACPGCRIEIYSDENSEGQAFEGETTSDESGRFSFAKGAPFAHPRVTAVATGLDGSTGPFSRSIGILNILQQGNEQARTPILPGSSATLADNRIGSQWHSLFFVTDEDRQAMLEENLAMGVKRFRLCINNSDSNNVDLFWSEPESTIDPKYDAFITRLAENGIRVTYLLSFWDKDFRNAGGTLTSPRFHTEDQILRYLDFVRFIVRHFKDRVQYYEIWNEPNGIFPMQQITVGDYINLVRRVVPVIRGEQPDAKIVVGSVTGISDAGAREYLYAILQSDIMPMVDVVAWHGLYGASPEYDDGMRWYYYEYPSFVRQIKNLAGANGFRGEFVADEILWHTPENAITGDPWTGAPDEIRAAKYMARGILINLGLDVSITQQDHGNYRRPPLVRFTIQNLASVMAGNKPVDLPVTIRSKAPNLKSYGFALPGGDTLLVLWSDGTTVDYAPGIPATLVFPGRAGQTAVGIDVLNGYEQKLTAVGDGDDLVIQDFLIQDYPLIIRLSGK